MEYTYDPDKINIRLGAPVRPRIVCLCGSTRFFDEYQRANYYETMAGRIVLSVGFVPDAGNMQPHGHNLGCTPEQKIALDELHKHKVELADEILVLNVGGYIGESTSNEIAHALIKRKPIRFLERDAGEAWLMEHRHVLAQRIADHVLKHRVVTADQVVRVRTDRCGAVGAEACVYTDQLASDCKNCNA
jgi:hypothetical protein